MDRPGGNEIVTFYSYKGGTGRSMALANVACLLAGQGDRVLMVDWDLEAPGLHRFFPAEAAALPDEVKGASQESDERPGLVDLLALIERRVPAAATPGGADAEAAVLAALGEIDLGLYTTETMVPSLTLMKAGRFDDGYVTRVSEFPWEALYRRSPDIYRLVGQWLSSRFRYVLIDSRTGLSDTSSICTTLLPEKLIVVFTPNRQSLSGVADLVKRATEYRRRSDDLRPLLVYPLPSRIEAEREDLRRIWRRGDSERGVHGYQPLFEAVLKEAYGLAECSLEEYFQEVQIQHSPDFAYGEGIAVRSGSAEDRLSLSRSYESFNRWLSNSYAPWESLEKAARRRRLEQVEKEVKALRAQGGADKARTAELEALQRTMLELREYLLGKRHPEYLRSLDDLADTYSALGDLEAERRIKEELVVALTQSLGGSHANTLEARLALATTLRTMGDFNGARGLQQQVVDASRSIGEDRKITLDAMSSLAETLFEQGDLAAAREVQERVLEASQRVFGEGHADALAAMNNLAETLRAMGDLGDARRLHEQVLEGTRRLFGNEHTETLTSMNNLAETLSERGDLAGARRLHEQVLAVTRSRMGDEHPESLTSMTNLAETMRALGDAASARILHEKVLEARRRALGEEHPETLTAMANLAATLYSLGDLAGAETMEEKVLAVRQGLLGEDHPDTLAAMHNLAETLAELGHHEEARLLNEKVLAGRRRVLGEEHPDTLISLSNLAATLHDVGDLQAAIRLEREVLGLRRRVLGDAHPDTLTSLSNLAETLRTLGQLDEACELHSAALEQYRSVLGDEHPDTLMSFRKLAELLVEQGAFPRARELYAELVDVSRRALGAGHRETLAAMGNLVVTLRAIGDLPAAAAVQDQLVEAARRLTGDGKR